MDPRRVNLRNALRALNVLQESLSIATPVASSVARVYPTVPDRTKKLTNFPAWLNPDIRMGERERRIGSAVTPVSVRMVLYIGERDTSLASEMAAAYLDALVVAIDQDITLGGTVFDVQLRSGDETSIGLLRWAGDEMIGLAMQANLTFRDAVDFGVRSP